MAKHIERRIYKDLKGIQVIEGGPQLRPFLMVPKNENEKRKKPNLGTQIRFFRSLWSRKREMKGDFLPGLVFHSRDPENLTVLFDSRNSENSERDLNEFL